ncbi:MAG TPA: hypothetical protein VGN39_01900, partial [Terriglobales bacterium]|nr:hypothetical protein [Terriglobales bacterium]
MTGSEDQKRRRGLHEFPPLQKKGKGGSASHSSAKNANEWGTRHHYYRRHSFDHYMLFDVDVAEKDKVPPGAPTSGPTATAE